MTRYEQGFMNKCAEYGVDAGSAMELMQKQAKNPRNALLASLFKKGFGFNTVNGIRAGQGSLAGLQIAGRNAVRKLFGKNFVKLNPTYWQNGQYLVDSAAQAPLLRKILT